MNLLYLDPGAGSLIIQIIIATITAIIVFYKRIIIIAKTFLRHLFWKGHENGEN